MHLLLKRVADASHVAETKVVHVEWNTSWSFEASGRVGVVLEPVTSPNVTIERASGFHYKFIRENGIWERRGCSKLT